MGGGASLILPCARVSECVCVRARLSLCGCDFLDVRLTRQQQHDLSRRRLGFIVIALKINAISVIVVVVTIEKMRSEVMPMIMKTMTMMMTTTTTMMMMMNDMID